MARRYDRMPVVWKENPCGQQKTVFSSAGIDHARQDGKFRFGKRPAAFRETAGNKEKAIGENQAAEPGHKTDYSPPYSAESVLFRLCPLGPLARESS